MASFCKQCSEDLFGFDGLDLIQPNSPGPGKGWAVICEGCGPTLVDKDGVCIMKGCLESHDRSN